MSTNKTAFLETAWEIGTELMRSAIWHENRKCTWLGYWIEPINGEYKPAMRTFGSDLYCGTSGIALLLACLYSERNDPILKQTLDGAVTQILDTMNSAPDHGYYCGKPGIAASLISMGRLLHRNDWILSGMELLATIKVEKISAHETDLISGVAGSIPLLLDVYAIYKNDFLLQKATQMGHLLCEAAAKTEAHWSWATVPANRNLTGFSHGASGIASALMRLYSATQIPLFLEASVKGLQYEQQNFDDSQQNWPDFREAPSEGKHSCAHAWCHGAPGIALSRLDTKSHIADTAIAFEAEIALKTTAANLVDLLQHHFPTSNYSLCHGLAGNADVLLQSGNPDYAKLAETIGLAGIEQYGKTRSQWPTGLNYNQYPTPGLMMGLAGTGYFYLRLYNSEKFRTVLLPQLLA